MKISIITTSYNSAKTIKDTIESVLGQTVVNKIEYILVDNLSTDSTAEIVKSYGDKIAKFVSEKDQGMYHAMNKGLSLASGDVIGILNSDDFYASPTVLEEVSKVFQDESVDCVWGDLLYVDRVNTNKIIRVWQSAPYIEGSFYKGWHPPHPTFFVRRRVYGKFGSFRLDMSTAADIEIMLRFFEKNRIKGVYLPRVLVKMRTGGQSNKSIYNWLRANYYSYKAFKVNGLSVSPVYMLRKPFSKIKQWFKK